MRKTQNKPSKLVDIGKQIRRMRLNLDITQTDLASRCKVTPSHISQIEHNERTPSIDMLYNIADSLGCSVKLIANE